MLEERPRNLKVVKKEQEVMRKNHWSQERNQKEILNQNQDKKQEKRM